MHWYQHYIQVWSNILRPQASTFIRIVAAIRIWKQVSFGNTGRKKQQQQKDRKYYRKKHCNYVPTPWCGGGCAGDILFLVRILSASVACRRRRSLHSISLMNGYILAKLTQIYHRLGKKRWLDFAYPIFKVTWGFSCLENGLKMACLHPISWRNKCILIKLSHLYCWGI